MKQISNHLRVFTSVAVTTLSLSWRFVYICLLILGNDSYNSSSFTYVPIIRSAKPGYCRLFMSGMKNNKDTVCDDNDVYEYDDSDAKSQFGTKDYWEDMYNGMGDFAADEYSWYYGFDTLKSYFQDLIPQPKENVKMLVPGIGNDVILLDLYEYGYQDITAFDYSSSAIERQKDLFISSRNENIKQDIKLLVRDSRRLDDGWTNEFDIIFEKGLLDAIHLSGEGYSELAMIELQRCTKVGGFFISVSGVVTDDIRQKMFPKNDWEWIRDGSNDLKAGCYVWKRK